MEKRYAVSLPQLFGVTSHGVLCRGRRLPQLGACFRATFTGESERYSTVLITSVCRDRAIYSGYYTINRPIVDSETFHMKNVFKRMGHLTRRASGIRLPKRCRIAPVKKSTWARRLGWGPISDSDDTISVHVDRELSQHGVVQQL